MADKETLTFEELAEWSRGRWVAGQHEASDNVKARAEALVRITNPKAKVVRNEDTGELTIDAPKQKSKEEIEAEELAELEKLEAEEKAKAKAEAAKKAGK